jgi:sRNA-binding protein
MAITPIDLQTNISQVIEIGRTEHAKAELLVAQQHLLEKQSTDKSKNTNTVLEESKKTEKTEIRHEEHNERNSNHEQGSENKKDENAPETRAIDDKMGKFIDVLK